MVERLVEQHTFAVVTPPDSLRTYGAYDCCTVVMATEGKALMGHIDSFTDIALSIEMMKSQFEGVKPNVWLIPGGENIPARDILAQTVANELLATGLTISHVDSRRTTHPSTEVMFSFDRHVNTYPNNADYEEAENLLLDENNMLTKGPFFNEVIKGENLSIETLLAAECYFRGRPGGKTPLFPITPIVQDPQLCDVPIVVTEPDLGNYVTRLLKVIREVFLPFVYLERVEEAQADEIHRQAGVPGGISQQGLNTHD